MIVFVAVWKFDWLLADPQLVQQNLPTGIRTLDETSACLPAGAYTTFRTYRRDRVLRLTDHLQRLEDTARLAGHPLSVYKPGVRPALRQVIELFRGEIRVSSADCGDLRLRLTLDLGTRPGDLYLAVECLVTPSSADYQRGVAVVTRRFERLLPEAKLTRFIDRSRPLRQSLPPGVNEAVMVNQAGALIEGLSSNFFAVTGGILRTAGTGVRGG
jgi:branched-subunit amino acid aminotransferase/4-amino-4-deoxychorismate lyase